MLEKLISAIGAFLFSSLIVGLIVLWVGVGSGLIDPDRLIYGERRYYPDTVMRRAK